MRMRAQGVNLEPLERSGKILEMEDYCILVTDGKNTYEIELEDDESVTMALLRSFFGEEATGLGYNNIATGKFRILRLEKEAVVQPKAGWDLTREYVVCKSTSCNDQEDSIRVDDQEYPMPLHQRRSSLAQGLLHRFMLLASMVVREDCY